MAVYVEVDFGRRWFRLHVIHRELHRVNGLTPDVAIGHRCGHRDDLLKVDVVLHRGSDREVVKQQRGGR